MRCAWAAHLAAIADVTVTVAKAWLACCDGAGTAAAGCGVNVGQRCAIVAACAARLRHGQGSL
jgi:hypothetical protein